MTRCFAAGEDATVHVGKDQLGEHTVPVSIRQLEEDAAHLDELLRTSALQLSFPRLQAIRNAELPSLSREARKAFDSAWAQIETARFRFRQVAQEQAAALHRRAADALPIASRQNGGLKTRGRP